MSDEREEYVPWAVVIPEDEDINTADKCKAWFEEHVRQIRTPDEQEDGRKSLADVTIQNIRMVYLDVGSGLYWFSFPGVSAEFDEDNNPSALHDEDDGETEFFYIMGAELDAWTDSRKLKWLKTLITQWFLYQLPGPIAIQVPEEKKEDEQQDGEDDAEDDQEETPVAKKKAKTSSSSGGSKKTAATASKVKG